VNVGQAITDGMRADRTRDLLRLMGDYRYRHVVQAYCWWGWAIHDDRKRVT
jgi:hypothetical protein